MLNKKDDTILKESQKKIRVIHVMIEYENRENKKANFRTTDNAISWLNLNEEK